MTCAPRLRECVFELIARRKSCAPDWRPDIDQMEAMVAATLAFARDAQAPGQWVKLEISSLVESVLDEAAETGADASAGLCEGAVVEAIPWR